MIEPGNFRSDPSGLRHFDAPGGITCGDMGTMLVAALRIHEANPAPSWFWFNDTPAPIIPGDTADTLADRWAKWRQAYQSGKLLDEIKKLRPN